MMQAEMGPDTKNSQACTESVIQKYDFAFSGVCDNCDKSIPVDLSEMDVEATQSVDHKIWGDSISLWRRATIGVPLNGFFFGFLSGLLGGTGYGFFLGYLGLDPYVLAAAGSIMKLPEVLLLPLGYLNDKVPIRGYRRKSYIIISWIISFVAFLVMCTHPLPDPYFCRGADGSYDYTVPPCNPGAHDHKSYYILPMAMISLGFNMGSVANEGLLLEYSQLEPKEKRGTIKAEMTMVTTAGQLAAALFIGCFMNGKEYLGTFDWSLDFNHMMLIAMILVLVQIPLTMFFVYEPQQRQIPAASVTTSWQLVKSSAFVAVLMFAFGTHMMVGISTTAAPLVRSQWAGVKVLQQQLYGMVSMVMTVLAVWFLKAYFLQTSWRKIFYSSCVAAVLLDAAPAFLTVFGVVRNQYFYLGEEILAALPIAALKLVSGLLLIEMSEPGREGLCFGLLGTVYNASAPFASAISNQIFGSFKPSLSDVANYVQDDPSFRKTVAWSYVVTYGTTMAGFVLIRLIPAQKEEAQKRKKEWGSHWLYAVLALGFPSICLLYATSVLVMANVDSVSCLEIVGGQGC
mmetsp:Transcript_95206/g.226686  ORF Transcript_95206/g.226686 Transcript_95206/m.226686 type:complete len:570 (-) Transcript_95206:231-1940(-)|eukprot:CAMPEP_0181433176 /NCGR_PEP_ID=MMETSP1110-20121109/19154_1 /TAXON_ID=174948 /ORGANISM="Symbiodinium sp., Strain CCMP421" /LENGTH=569 /DNA_ID=CAMNT_0023556615 /DNA_START=44 /DNA_END=1753 /DNA_ORIENTATION=-